jgi:hypothetical protein
MYIKRHRIILTIAVLCYIQPLFGQKDTVSIQNKSISKAAIQTIGINMGVWVFDRYIMNEPWANISFNTIKQNFKNGFVWDNDQFSTNLLGHPYHGGLYFNAARVNGMNFWQSEVYSATGSLMWEFMCENEPPSINDFIATTIGGMALGEITFRLSDLLINNNYNLTRFQREMLIMLTSPMRGLNRLFNGEAWKPLKFNQSTTTDPLFRFYMETGYKTMTSSMNARFDNKFDNGMFLAMNLSYGNIFSIENEKPFDAFMAATEFNFLSKQPFISDIHVIGHLWGKDIGLKNEKSDLYWGFFQHFDYYNSNTINDTERNALFRISQAAAFGPGGQFIYRLSKKSTFVASSYINAILLGGSITDYYKIDNRDYNMGNGFNFKWKIRFLLGEKMYFSASVDDYHIFTWKGYDADLNLSQLSEYDKSHLNAQGDIGKLKFTVYNFDFNFLVKNNFTVSFKSAYYLHKAHYKYFPDTQSQLIESKFCVGYIF